LLWDTTNDNRVTLNFRPHLDEELQNCPFNINNKSAVVPANKTLEFALSFKTTEVGTFKALALATPTVVNKKEGQPVLPELKLLLAAESVQPVLVSSLQKMKIMYPSNHPANRNPPSQSLVLHNKSKAGISVSLQIEPNNFSISSVNSTQQKLSNGSLTSRLRDAQTVYNLAISDSLEISVSFVPSSQHIEKREDTIVEGKLSICHGNGHKQVNSTTYRPNS
jgi:hypothetical protein